jgi:hypothetical protein
MVTVIFRCPRLGLRVQGWFADNESEDSEGVTYQSMTCLACRQMHLVNPRSGKVLGDDDE